MLNNALIWIQDWDWVHKFWEFGRIFLKKER